VYCQRLRLDTLHQIAARIIRNAHNLIAAVLILSIYPVFLFAAARRLRFFQSPAIDAKDTPNTTISYHHDASFFNPFITSP
jgi:hypothetical protein